MSNAISYSKAAALECPYYFRKFYLEGLRDTYTAPPLERGKVFHELMAGYIDRLISIGRTTDNDWLRERAAALTAGLPQDVANDVLLLTENTANWFILPGWITDGAKTEVKIGIEYRAEEGTRLAGYYGCEFDAPEALYRCVIDVLAIDGGIIQIRDYKTGWNIETAGALSRDRQLRWYSWAALLMYPRCETVYAGHIYPRNRFLERVVDEPFTLESLADVPSEIASSITRAADMGLVETHEPRACRMCALCPLQCRLRVDGVSVPPSEPAAAAKLAVELEYLEAKLQEGKRSLKAYAEEYGAVMGAAREWRFHTGLKKTIAVEALDFIREHDPDMAAKIGLSIPAHLLKAKKRAAIAEGLGEFTTQSPYSIFRSFKPSEPEEDDDE